MPGGQRDAVDHKGSLKVSRKVVSFSAPRNSRKVAPETFSRLEPRSGARKLTSFRARRAALKVRRIVRVKMLRPIIGPDFGPENGPAKGQHLGRISGHYNRVKREAFMVRSSQSATKGATPTKRVVLIGAASVSSDGQVPLPATRSSNCP